MLHSDSDSDAEVMHPFYWNDDECNYVVGFFGNNFVKLKVLLWSWYKVIAKCISLNIYKVLQIFPKTDNQLFTIIPFSLPTQ